jgi:hypothetical protein
MFSFPPQNDVLRGKTLSAEVFARDSHELDGVSMMYCIRNQELLQHNNGSGFAPEVCPKGQGTFHNITHWPWASE